MSAATASSRPGDAPLTELRPARAWTGGRRAGTSGAQLRHRLRRQRGQRDLAALGSRAGLDVDREDAEQPLQRALPDVDGLDPVQPDVGVLGAEQPRVVMDRLGSRPCSAWSASGSAPS